MGYQEVYEEDAALRSIYGAHPDNSRSVWIMTLDYLLDKAVETEVIDRLNLLYAKYNLGDKAPETPNVLDGNIVYWDVGGTTPTDSDDVLAMNMTTLVGGKFILVTGNVETKFKVALPPVRTITDVQDLTAGPLPVTDQYLFIGTVPVDIGGDLFDYNIYEMNIAIAYTISHDHEITT